MNLSYKWLKELVETDATPEELGEMLTRAGCAVEEIEPADGGDHMLVAEVTTNRPDWLCHNGIAHEIAALTGKEISLPEIELTETGPDVKTLTSVEVTDEAKEFCPRYTARVIRGVQVKESPEWLKQRLLAIGQRPINNIVDITNLVCFEMNQPLHAFDYDLLAENRIVVRMARQGEEFKAITGEEGKLSDTMLVIADAGRAMALAGVKGGCTSEVHAGTVNVLIESAWFQPQQVRRSSRASKMSSESSYRFERGIDPGMTERASARAAQLVLELAGGTLAKGVIDTNPTLAAPWNVEMRFGRCEKVLGCVFEHLEIENIMRGLGLDVIRKDASQIKVGVPTFRQDLVREIDLIEEVARVAGYDRIPSKMTMPLMRSHDSELVSAKRGVRSTLSGLGYYETFNDSFVPEKWLAEYPVAGGDKVRVMNPINHERPILRTTLIPSLLDIRRINRGRDDVQLFDIGHTYSGGKDGTEPNRLAILDDRGLEYVRGALEDSLSAMRVCGAVKVAPADCAEAFAAGSGARVFVGDSEVGIMGIVGDGQVKIHDLDLAPAVLEVDLGLISELEKAGRLFKPLPKFPGVRRDIAMVVPEEVQWGTIGALVRELPEKQEELEFQSIFRGKGIDPGKKSVAFGVTFRSPEGSLTDDEANALRDAIVEHLQNRIEGAKLR